MYRRMWKIYTTCSRRGSVARCQPIKERIPKGLINDIQRGLRREKRTDDRARRNKTARTSRGL